MNQLAQDLRAAKALIDTPEKWTKGKLIRRDENDQICAMCSIGAIYVATQETLNARHYAAKAAFREAAGCVEGLSISYWNDAPERTHAEVMAAFDRAIEKAEASHA